MCTALAAIDYLWQWWQTSRKDENARFQILISQFFLPVALYALIAAPYIVFSLFTTGRPLPNTFYAKVGSQYFLSLRTLQEIFVWHFQDNPISLLLLLFAIKPLWSRSRLAVLWLVGLPLFTAVVVDFTWHHGRYTLPLIPLQMVAAAIGIWSLVFIIRKSQWLKPESKHSISPMVITAVVLLFITAGLWRMPYWAELLGHNTQEIQDIDITMGKWLADNTSADITVAVDDIGAIGFISERQILDLNGLISPEVWPAYQAEEGLARNQILTRILSQSKPNLMAAFPLWRWDIATNPAVSEPLFHATTDTHTIIFQQDAFIYEMTWPYLQEAFPENEVGVLFGDAMKLLGYDMDISDNLIELTLYWESSNPISQSYDVFVHLIDDKGQIVAQIDQKPVGGLAATDIWEIGDIVRDPLSINLPHDLASGSYELMVGVYLKESGERLAIKDRSFPNNALVLESLVLP